MIQQQDLQYLDATNNEELVETHHRQQHKQTNKQRHHKQGALVYLIAEKEYAQT